MIRIDSSSVVVMSVATASALATALWLNRLGEAHEAPAVAWTAPAPLAPPASAPATPASASGTAAQIVRSPDGHYWAEALIDGRAVRVMVDTGASLVALTRQDALRLGLRLAPSDFDLTVETAAGPTRAARVELDFVSVAGARVERVPAMVVEAGLPHSLLGMSYLGRLSGFTATPGELVLRP